MNRVIKQFIAGVAIIAALQPMFAVPSMAQDRSEEYQLKAVLLSRLMGFVTWPQLGEGDPITLCVAGQNPFDGQLDAAFNETNVTIEMIGNQYGVVDNCNVLFISDSEIRNFESILDLVADKPILTISDVPRFASSGGMINLTFDNRRVRFLINKEEADAVDVRLSFQLLSLADIVTTRPDRR